MKPKKLPYKLFLKSFQFAPRPAVNLLVEREVYETSRGRNGKFCKLPIKEVLLTKRKKPPFAGSWHLPGSFILKGEALIDCAKRVAREELGIKIEIKIKIKIKVGKVKRLTGLKKRQDKFTLVGVFDDIDGDPRGHVVDLVYRCQIKPDQKGQAFFGKAWPFQPVGDSAEIKFFKKLPQNIGFNHRETLNSLGYK